MVYGGRFFGGKSSPFISAKAIIPTQMQIYLKNFCELPLHFGQKMKWYIGGQAALFAKGQLTAKIICNRSVKGGNFVLKNEMVHRVILFLGQMPPTHSVRLPQSEPILFISSKIRPN